MAPDSPSCLALHPYISPSILCLSTFPSTIIKHRGSGYQHRPMISNMATSRDRLSFLPSELQIQIIDQLGYLDRVRLSSTSKYFFSIVDPQAVSVGQKKREIRVAERWAKHNRVTLIYRFDDNNFLKFTVLANGYACFGCFKVLDKSAFARNQTEEECGFAKRDYGYQNPGLNKRVCVQCKVRSGKYQPGMVLNAVTSQTMELGRMSKTKSEVVRLLVCFHCGKAHKIVSIGPPQICSGCEDVQLEIDGSKQGKDTMQARKKGYETVECQGCGDANNIRIATNNLRCEGCDQRICRRCFASRSPECKCQEVGDAFLGLGPLFE